MLRALTMIADAERVMAVLTPLLWLGSATMRSDLDHLPASKQRELEHVVRILFEEFAEVLARATQPWKKAGRILKLVLYGSYSRGDWVDDRVSGYRSDYDILVVVNDERLTDVVDYWSVAEDRLMREFTIAKTLSAPVGFIVHTLTDVNHQLERGRPFFIDIVQQGVSLYEAEGFCFTAPKKLPPAETLIEAQGYFDYWYPQALSAKLGADFFITQGKERDAAFMLHQAVERLFHCTLLVLTLHSPKSHKLTFLRSHCEQIELRLVEAWLRGDKFSRRCFELLRQAYVNARYSPQYSISEEQLNWLSGRVGILQRLVKEVCEQRLADLQAALPKVAQ
jgi:predicted nucleotidyltransferase/HEPN domain-containing protein